MHRFKLRRGRLKRFYGWTGRPSIDPEVLLRWLLVGYLYGITSERRPLEEVRMPLACLWFPLDFGQEVPDRSTFSKNRYGRFRQSGVFREVFEEIVRRCLARRNKHCKSEPAFSSSYAVENNSKYEE